MTYLPDDAAGKTPGTPRADRSGVSASGSRRTVGTAASSTGAATAPSTEPSTGATSASGESTRAQLREAQGGGLGRNLGTTGIGTLLPGSGLMLAGRFKTGLAMLSVFVLALLAAASFVYWRGGTRETGTFLAAYVTPRPRLWTVLGALAALALLVWIVSVFVTSWLTRPRGGLRRGAAALFALAMAAVLVVPSVYAANRLSVGRSALNDLFGTPKLKAAASAAAPEITADDPWANVPRINVLLIGADAYPDRKGIRTDSMMLATIDTKTGNTLLIGIPRNLTGWQLRSDSPMRAMFPSGVAHCSSATFSDCELTNLWSAVQAYAEAHPNAYPGDKNPSLTELRNVIGDFTGLQVDNTVMVDIRGFSSLVDAMGGVDITVRERLPIGGRISNGQIVPGSINGWIEPGKQHLDGYHAMWYSRSRATTNDFSRMKRQRCMLGALARQVSVPTLIDRFPQIAKVAQDNLQFDISLAQLPAWETLAERVQKGKISSLPFTSTLFDNVHPNYDWVHAYIAHAIDPTQPAPTTDGFGKPLPKATASATAKPKATGTASKSVNPNSNSSNAGADGVVDVDNAC